MHTSRYRKLYFIILIVIFGGTGLAAPNGNKQTKVKEATNSAVPIEEGPEDENATGNLTAQETEAKIDVLQRIEQAPKGKVSSTAKKTTKDPVHRLLYTGHQILWFLGQLWERFKYTVKRTVDGIRMRRYGYGGYGQYSTYSPGYGR